MAFSCIFKSQDCNFADSDIASEAADGILISNDSYGWLMGWVGS